MSKIKESKTSDSSPIPKWYQKNVNEIFKDLHESFHKLVDIKVGMDQRGSIRNIMDNKEMIGANAWLLMCSIMVASLGLDRDSPAVIIGAMLISPLMSPILGIGLGVAVNDRKTLFISLKHFSLAIIIALVTSYIYFSLTPFGIVTNEIAARTEPNLLDGLIAIFGGLAGVISSTRKDKSNAIPGVAIATALMPPLCVAGFGLAKGEMSFFLNAFYLFFLNSFFIAISTYTVIRILGFRYKEYPNEAERKRNFRFIVVFSNLILIPAINLLVNAGSDLRDRLAIEKYIKAHFENEATAIADWNTYPTDSIMQLDIQLIGEPMHLNKIEACDAALEEILKKPIRITAYQSGEIPFEDIQKLKKAIGGVENQLQTQIANLEQIQQQRELKIDQLTKELDSLQNRVILADIFEECKSIFPFLTEIGFTKELQKTNFSEQIELPILLIKWDKQKPLRTKEVDAQKLQEFMQKRANLDTLIVVAY